MSTRRDGDVASATPTAKFLQARIDTLRTSLVRRLEGIFATALEDNESNNPPSLTDTAVKQMQIDVESTALIRAAEEIMLLTRTMKELWLFGDLSTIPEDDTNESRIREQMQTDEQEVMKGLMQYLATLGVNSG